MRGQSLSCSLQVCQSWGQLTLDLKLVHRLGLTSRHTTRLRRNSQIIWSMQINIVKSVNVQAIQLDAVREQQDPPWTKLFSEGYNFGNFWSIKLKPGRCTSALPCYYNYEWIKAPAVCLNREVVSTKSLPFSGTDRQTDRRTDRQTDRQTDGQAQTYIPPFHGG